MPKKTGQFAHARQKAEKVVEALEAEHRRQLLKRRIELANMGVRYYKAGKVGEAVTAFQSYLRILEDWKNCEVGGLNPSHFDLKRDVAELLLISGIYWDLSKIYDRAQAQDKHEQFAKYLDKFVLFSRGMPYQTLCAETLRRFLMNEKIAHRAQFKNAYKIIGVSRCFVATSLADVSQPETLPRLREFRDGYLRKRSWGRAFIKWYYRNGPGMAAVVNRCPCLVRKLTALSLDFIAKRLV